MRVLVLEHEDAGCGLAFCLRCLKAGHEVRYWIPPDGNKEVGKDFPKLERLVGGSFLPSVRWADLVWCTGNHQFIAKLDYLKTQGVRVYAPSVKSTALEVKRAEGMRFLEKHGIEVPAYKVFGSLADAEAHQRGHDERFVFKTLGDEEDKSLSYVGKTPADMVARLQHWQNLGMKPKGQVMLQKVIDGVEFGVDRWMGKEGFIGPYNEHFEHKKLLSGNCGPNCGEAGTVQKYCEDSKLGDLILAPIEEALVELGHLGDIAVNCIVDSAGKPWPLEFTARPGWPEMNIMLATHKGDPAQWMLDACKGEDTMDCTTAIACGVVLAQPDYPYSEKTKAETLDIPIAGVTDDNRRFIAPQSVKMAKLPQDKDGKIVEAPMWASCGDYLAVVTGVGKSVRQACGRAYKVVKQIHVPNLMWRDDIGEKLEEELPKLQAHGFATEFVYG